MIRRILILLVIHSCIYTNGNPGASLQYGTNAREIALSNSLIANYNKGYNSFTNPALLGTLSKREYGFSYFSMSLDRSIQTLSVAFLEDTPPAPSSGPDNSLVTSIFNSHRGGG